MGLGDVWHRTLVYFGIAEEYEDSWEDAYLTEEELTTLPPEPVPTERASTNVRRLTPRREPDGQFDDWTSAEPSPRARPRAVPPPAGTPVQVHLVLPRSFNDAKQIADKFKQAVPVIVNLQNADQDLSKRLIDFASGLTYALNGSMQRVADRVFLLTPPNVEVSAEERARALESGNFFNQA
jgi:cell division inhibitor SepF